MKSLLQRLIRALGGYELYRVYESGGARGPALPMDWDVRPVDTAARAALAAEGGEKPSRLARAPSAPELAYFALWAGGTLLAVALFEPAFAAAGGAMWVPAEGELILTDLWTLAAARGRGAAPALIAESQRRLDRPLVGWTWWTNRPAIRAFRKAGWRAAGWSLRIASLPRYAWRRGRAPL